MHKGRRIPRIPRVPKTIVNTYPYYGYPYGYSSFPTYVGPEYDILDEKVSLEEPEYDITEEINLEETPRRKDIFQFHIPTAIITLILTWLIFK